MEDIELLQHEMCSGLENREYMRSNMSSDADFGAVAHHTDRERMDHRKGSKPASPVGAFPEEPSFPLHIPLDARHHLPRSYPLSLPLRAASVPADFDATAPASPGAKGDRRRAVQRKQDVESNYSASPRAKRAATNLPAEQPVNGSLVPLVDDTSSLSMKAKVIELVPEAAKAVYENDEMEESAQWMGSGSPWPPTYCATLPALTAEGRSFYPAVSMNGVEYQLFDNVIVRPALEGMMDGVARIVAQFEESPSGRKYFYLEWYFRKPDVLTHLLLMRDIEELLRNPLPSEDDPLGEKRAVRRGRPPKKRRGNIEESLQWLDFALEHEIWNSPRPYYSAVPISAVSSACFIEHVPHHITALPLPEDRSPDDPPRFMYRKSYDPRTCYMPCSKPRSTLASPGSLVPTATSQSIGASILSHSGSASFNSASQPNQASQSNTKAATLPIPSKSVKLALRSESMSSLPPTPWDYETEGLSPRSKVAKTSEVDHNALHRQPAFNLTQSIDTNVYSSSQSYPQLSSHHTSTQHFGSHSDSAKGAHGSAMQSGTVRFTQTGAYESMDVSTSPQSHHGSTQRSQGQQQQQKGQGMAPFGYTAPQMGQFKSPRSVPQPSNTTPLPNRNVNSSWHNNNGTTTLTGYLSQATSTPPSVGVAGGAGVVSPSGSSDAAEVIVLRARLEQMSEDVRTMQQSMTEMRETMMHLQMHHQQQHYFAPQLPRQSPSNTVEHFVPAGLPAAAYPMASTNTASNFSSGNSLSNASPMGHVSFTPNRISTTMPTNALGAGQSMTRNVNFGASSLRHMTPAASANFSAFEQQDIIVAPNDLKDDAYDSPLEDFSVSSDPIDSSFSQHHMILSDRSVHSQTLNFSYSRLNSGDLSSSAAQPVTEFGIEQFFMPEHIAAQ